MAKDPAMLWYWADWHSGTVTFSRFLKGCYMDVLHAQFNSGHLSLEEIKTVLGSDFGQAWPAIQKKFTVDPAGKYFNERLEEEKIKRANYTASRRKNLESTHMDNHMHQHMPQHMENVNGNINVVDNGIKKGVQGETKEELFQRLFHDEQWSINVKKTHAGKDLAIGWDQCHLHHTQSPRPPETIWEWRQKFNTWLSIMKPEPAVNGHTPKKKRSFAEYNQGKS